MPRLLTTSSAEVPKLFEHVWRTYCYEKNNKNTHKLGDTTLILVKTLEESLKNAICTFHEIYVKTTMIR